MIYYPAPLLQFLIVGSLVLTGLAAVILLVMVLVDFIRKQVW
jgi:hypothetical protein